MLLLFLSPLAFSPFRSLSLWFRCDGIDRLSIYNFLDVTRLFTRTDQFSAKNSRKTRRSRFARFVLSHAGTPREIRLIPLIVLLKPPACVALTPRYPNIKSMRLQTVFSPLAYIYSTSARALWSASGIGSYLASRAKCRFANSLQLPLFASLLLKNLSAYLILVGTRATNGILH